MSGKKTPESRPYSKDLLLRLYRSMLRMRLAEEKVAELYPQQEMRCPVHLHIGQEGVSAGVAANLVKEDRVFGSHRSHGPYLAMGGSLNAFYAELYGKETGCCRGRGGSMHLVDKAVGYWGSSAIVAGTIPIAVGAALEAKYNGRKDVAACFFGDGAADEGVFYESLSYAALKQLPVLFVCENNQYATNSHQRGRQAKDNIFERAAAFGVKGVRTDGNDVLAVCEAAREAVSRARGGGGPTLIECDTYRWKGHVGPASDIQMGYRTQADLDAWMARCPIRRFEILTLGQKVLAQADLDAVRSEVQREVEEGVAFAKASPDPDPAAMFMQGARP